MSQQNLRDYFFGLPKADRSRYADRAGTTVGVVTQLAYGHKKAELGLADCLVAAAAGAVNLDGIPMTDRAKRQLAIRATPALPATPAEAQA
jgi:hypothetical protein